MYSTHSKADASFQNDMDVMQSRVIATNFIMRLVLFGLRLAGTNKGKTEWFTGNSYWSWTNALQLVRIFDEAIKQLRHVNRVGYLWAGVVCMTKLLLCFSWFVSLDDGKGKTNAKKYGN